MIRIFLINTLSSLVFATAFILFVFLPQFTYANHCTPPLVHGSSGICIPPGNSVNNPSSGSSTALQNPLQMNDLVSVIVAIANILLILAVPIIIIFIVYAGFLYVTAQGNTTKIQDAHRALLYALIGGAVVLGAGVVGFIIANTVNSITVP